MKGKIQPKEIQALSVGIDTQSMAQMLRDSTDKPAMKEITEINSFGTVVLQRCTHQVIPGLDADFCRECSTWYVNALIRANVLNNVGPYIFQRENKPALKID